MKAWNAGDFEAYDVIIQPDTGSFGKHNQLSRFSRDTFLPFVH